MGVWVVYIAVEKLEITNLEYGHYRRTVKKWPIGQAGFAIHVPRTQAPG
jgi:hypothetical protein